MIVSAWLTHLAVSKINNKNISNTFKGTNKLFTNKHIAQADIFVLFKQFFMSILFKEGMFKNGDKT